MRHLCFVLCATGAAFPAVTSAQCPQPIVQLLSERKTDEARVQAQALLAKSSRDHQAHHCLGRVEMALDRPRAATEHFEAAIKVAPTVAAYHLWLGNALGSLGDSTSKIKLPFLARRIKSEF